MVLSIVLKFWRRAFNLLLHGALQDQRVGHNLLARLDAIGKSVIALKMPIAALPLPGPTG